MNWTVGEAARIARVSVRTLHHYDEIGLLCPSERSEANYRRYTARDLERLHQILVFRELGFALPEIRRIMHTPDFDRTQALRRQRALLVEKQRRLGAVLHALDAALIAAEGGNTMTTQDLRELFDGFDPSEYQEEVRERWGDTEAYRQSAERTKSYTKADWTRMKTEMDDITRAYVALMDASVAPDAPEARAVAGRHHAHIEQWFYDCPPEMFASLSQLWVNDPRFTRNIDKARAGLAAYQSAAAQAWVAGQHTQ